MVEARSLYASLGVGHTTAPNLAMSFLSQVGERFMITVLLLLASNLFMTIAWYGHLRFKHVDLWKVVVISWGIAFFEYCLMVPANRWGHKEFSAAQLKTMQEIITLVVFCGFSVLYLKEPLKWNYLVGFAFIGAAGYFVFKKW